MSRDICVCLSFLSEAHEKKIRETADRLGFTPHFFSKSQKNEAIECLQHCEIFYGHSPNLLRTASVNLKWYCCAGLFLPWVLPDKWHNSYLHNLHAGLLPP